MEVHLREGSFVEMIGFKKIRVGEDGWIYNPVGITDKERVCKTIKVGRDSFD